MAETLIPAWTLQDRLVKARHVAGMSQTVLAGELGIGFKTLQRYEQGSTSVPKAVLIGWAVTCGVSVSWLVTGLADTGTDSEQYADQLSLSLTAA